MKIEAIDIPAYIADVGQRARAASRQMATASTLDKNEALRKIAALIRDNGPVLQQANELDTSARSRC